MEIDLRGETLILSAERALLWPRHRMLIIADPHFGKIGVFQQAGIPIPEGIDAHDLGRLDRLIAHDQIQRLTVLADFFHGRPAASPSFLAAFTTWLDQHSQLAVTVIAGNHDRHGGVGRWAPRIQWLSTPWSEPPFTFAHAPLPGTPGYVLCGHLHPVARLRAASGDRARLPAFWFMSTRGILPAFGAFTGGAVVQSVPDDRLFVIVDDQVVPIRARPTVNRINHTQSPAAALPSEKADG